MRLRVVRTSFLFVAMFLCAAIAASAQSGTSPTSADQQLLAGVDATASFLDSDFSAEYTIVQDRPGQGLSTTVVGIFRRDANETYAIIVMQPLASRGQGYLRQGNTLWVYDPQSRRFNTTSNTARFQNTNARNSDFTRSTLAQDYKIIAAEDAVLGRFKTRLLTLEAVTTEVTFPRMRVWISEEGLLRQTEDMSLSGQLLRTTAIPDYHRLDGRFVPRQMLFVDALRGAQVGGRFENEKTQITISRPSFSPLADSVFSKTFLESVSR